ncbi:MAG: sugar ABC transporter permease [Clostridia bacterium]|nr:sugar ABC transporter permease [Clostridia bacterium]
MNQAQNNVSAPVVEAPVKKKKPVSLTKRKARAGWLFVLPFVVGLLVLYIPIILDSICFSFFEIIPTTSGYSLQFQGIKFYHQALFVNATFTTTLVAGIKQLLVDTPMILIFSLFIAVVLNQKMMGRAAFRAIFFIPVVLSTGLMETINASDTLSDYMGGGSGGGISDGSGTNASSEIVSAVDIERLFEGLKIGTGLVEYVSNAVNSIYDIVNRSGVQMLIFLAGLQGISPSIYEASSIEGATAWETFWKITFPMISPMILVNAIYTIIDSFTSQSNVVMSFIAGIYQNSQATATAMSWIYFIVIMAIIGLFVLIASSFVFYQRRDS